VGCANCKSNSCSGTCGCEVSKYATSSLIYDGAKFICTDSEGGTIFEIRPCMTLNELFDVLFENLCNGLNALNNSVANVGAGSEWYKGLNGGVHEFRTLLVDPGLTAVQNANDITLSPNLTSSDASITITVVGSQINLQSVASAGVVNVGSGSGEIYAGISAGNHQMRRLQESKWIKIDTVGSDVEIRGKRIGHRETTFKAGSKVDRFNFLEGSLNHIGEVAITDLGSELSIIPISEYLCFVTAFLKCSVNIVGTDPGELVFKFELPDDIGLNTSGAVQITDDYVQNNIATCFYDFQLFDPTTDVSNRYDNTQIAEAIAYYDDGLGTNEIFPMGTVSGNVLAIRYIGYNGVPGLYYFNARVTIPIKLDSDWDYLETISTNYIRNW